jgi:LPS O-antigen subunit length determinant protein (WzzB/FepE family)
MALLALLLVFVAQQDWQVAVVIAVLQLQLLQEG